MRTGISIREMPNMKPGKTASVHVEPQDVVDTLVELDNRRARKPEARRGSQSS
jgi:hypothetical protein